MNGYETSMVQRTTQAPRRAHLRLVSLVVGGLLLLLLGIAAPAQAEFGIVPGSFRVDALKADGTTLDTQAGGHPYQAVASMRFRTVDFSTIPIDPDENVKDIEVTLPRGFLGNPQASAKCSRDDFDALVTTFATCPPASQVGVVELETLIGGAVGPMTVPLYNIDPRAGETADFGLPVSVVAVHSVASVRTESDYKLVVKFKNVSQAVPIMSARLTFWGVPADASHDTQRSCFPGGIITGSPCSAGLPRKPFLTNPSVCEGPVTTYARVNSWQQPDVYKTDESTTSVGPSDCAKQKFEATADSQPDTRRAGAPAGYTVELNVPQNDDPDGLATPPLKRAVVTLPLGTSISPSAADGLQSCDDAQIAIGSNAEPTCPEASKAGTVVVDTPLLAEPMRGDVYIGRPQPGQIFRLFLTMRGPGLLIKLAGNVNPDPVTGQITATFDDNPPLPFSRLRLQMKGGSRAILSNPTTCGPATTTARFWGHGVDKVSTSSSSFQVSQDGNGAPCPPRGFAPSFKAGTINAVAGAATPFTLTFGRGDQDQELGGITVAMPEGLTGMLASATLCTDQQAAAGTCGEGSRIGSVTTGAGPGATPFHLPGRAYITGPYKGAPFGMSIVVPAIAGPFNLGTVVVRAAVFVDRNTTALRIVSDPLPTILEGVPLQIRSVNVLVDRRGFMLNPTSCKAKSVLGQVASAFGAVVDRSSRFQVGGCKNLPFAPKMTLKVGARGKLTSGKRTPLEVTLAMPRGQANNRSVQVTLPLALNARLDVVNKRRACSLEQFRADRCPMAVGEATATTPLLRDPLKGPAYFVYTPERRLPDLVVRLKGQVDVDLVGKVTLDGLKLRTTFDTVPDVPITKFRLALASGNTNGPIGATRNLCAAATRKGLKAQLDLIAQSGKRVTRSQQISVAGCGKAKRSTRKTAKK